MIKQHSAAHMNLLQSQLQESNAKEKDIISPDFDNASQFSFAIPQTDERQCDQITAPENNFEFEEIESQHSTMERLRKGSLSVMNTPEGIDENLMLIKLTTCTPDDEMRPRKTSLISSHLSLLKALVLIFQNVLSNIPEPLTQKTTRLGVHYKRMMGL